MPFVPFFRSFPDAPHATPTGPGNVPNDTARRPAVRNFRRRHTRVCSLSRIRVSRTGCETESLGAVGHVNLGLMRGRCCGVSTGMRDGPRGDAGGNARRAGWRFRISPSGKQARRSVPQRPVQPSFSIHFRNARTPGLRLESAVVMRQHRAGALTCRSNRGTSAPRSISRAITLECPIAAPMPSTAASTTML